MNLSQQLISLSSRSSVLLIQGLRWTIFSWFALEQWIIRFYASGNSIMSLDCTDKNVRELHELIDYVTKVETNWSRNFGFNLNQSIRVNKWFCYRWLEHRALHCVTIYLIDKFGTRELFSVARSLNSIVHKQSFSNNEAFFVVVVVLPSVIPWQQCDNYDCSQLYWQLECGIWNISRNVC